MRILIFGTGKIYQRHKNSIRKTVEVIGFLDNDIEKQGTTLDGKKIYAPQVVSVLDYDYIALFSRSDENMKEQLIKLGVRFEDILQYDKLYKVLECRPTLMEGKLQNECQRKILVFSHAYTFSGAQNVLLKSIEILQKNGFGIACVSNEDGELRHELRDKGVTVILCEDFTSPMVWQAIDWADTLLINTLWLQYLSEEFVNSGKRIIWWLHESGSLTKYKPLELNYLLNKENVEIYAVSEKIIDYISTFYDVADHIQIMPFGLPEYSCEKIEGKDKIRFMQIGPFCELKGQDILVKAIDGLEHKYKNRMELNLIGGGETDQEIKSLIACNECIHVLGSIPNENIPDYYAKTDVVICCSREESMSVVVMEGFMNGIPAIVSDVTGITEYMEDGREGLIFQSGNVAELQQKIMYMVDHRDKAVEMGRNARKNYLKNFTMEQFEKNLLRVFEV